MSLDGVATWMFVAGVLAGFGIAIMGSLVPELPRVFRDYRDYFRRHRRNHP